MHTRVYTSQYLNATFLTASSHLETVTLPLYAIYEAISAVATMSRRLIAQPNFGDLPPCEHCNLDNRDQPKTFGRIMNLVRNSLVLASLFFPSSSLRCEEPSKKPSTFCNPISLPNYPVGRFARDLVVLRGKQLIIRLIPSLLCVSAPLHLCVHLFSVRQSDYPIHHDFTIHDFVLA